GRAGDMLIDRQADGAPVGGIGTDLFVGAHARPDGCAEGATIGVIAERPVGPRSPTQIAQHGLGLLGVVSEWLERVLRDLVERIAPRQYRPRRELRVAS